MAYTKPIPEINADNRIFWENCHEHLLTLQKCIACGTFRNPPAFMCPHCLSRNFEWVPVSGKGSIYTFAVYHTSFHPGFEEEIPYITAVVELAEGPRMMSNIVECPPRKSSAECQWKSLGRMRMISFPYHCSGRIKSKGHSLTTIDAIITIRDQVPL